MASKPPQPTLTPWYPSNIDPRRAGYYELFVPVAVRPPVLPVFAQWTGTGWAKFSGGDRDNLAVMNAQEYMETKLVY